ncbi:MAG: flagellar basal body protein, partial [Bryobacteraceae bacterium]
TRHPADGARSPYLRPISFPSARFSTRCKWNGTCFHAGIVIDSLSASLEQYMNVISLRQKLVASNIANADTPGYKTQDVDFQDSLRSAIDGGSPTTVQVSGLAVKNDGNNVDLDREARLLAENAMRFNVAASLMHSELQQVKEAIQGGK